MPSPIASLTILTTAAAIGGFAATRAHAQWSVPTQHYPGRGVTARGDAWINVTAGTIQAGLQQTGSNPSLRHSATEKRIVAFEFSTADIFGLPADCDVSNPWVLRIPIEPTTAEACFKLTWYESSADGRIDSADLTRYLTNPLQDEVTACVPAGATLIEFAESEMGSPVRYPYETRQLYHVPARQYVGFFLERIGAFDTQETFVLNGGARIELDEPFQMCTSMQPVDSPAVCFAQFTDQQPPRWVLVELVDSHYDWGLNEFVVDGAIVETDPDTGYVVGCNITEYPGGFVENVTNYYPHTTGANFAAYEVDLDVVFPPVGPSNRVRVSVGFQAFDTERAYQQKALLYHAPSGVSATAVNVTDEFRSNRAGLSDGGWIASLPQSSASPFIIAFSDGPADRCGEVAIDGFSPRLEGNRRLGSTLPLRFSLRHDQAVLDSTTALDAIGLTDPTLRVFDLTGGAATLVLGDLVVRDSGAQWAHELQLSPAHFTAGRHYEVRVQLGECEVAPADAHFHIR